MWGVTDTVCLPERAWMMEHRAIITITGKTVLGRCVVGYRADCEATDANRDFVIKEKNNQISLFSLNGVPYVTSVSRSSFGRYAAARPPCSMANVSTTWGNIGEYFSPNRSHIFYRSFLMSTCAFSITALTYTNIYLYKIIMRNLCVQLYWCY